jgi:hypothetical protein
MLLFVRTSATLAKAQADLITSSKDLGPFGGLATLIGNSVGLEWGWLPHIGGALAIVALALLAPGKIVLGTGAHKDRDDEERSFSSADKIIEDYLENRKISPTIRNQSAGSPLVVRMPTPSRRHETIFPSRRKGPETKAA